MNSETVAAALFGNVDEIHTTLRIEGYGDTDFAVLSFEHEDALSSIAQARIAIATSSEVSARLDEALGREASFVVSREGATESKTTLRGIVAEVMPGGMNVGRGRRAATVVLEPLLSELGRVERSRVYQKLDVVAIAKDLFASFRIDVDVRLHAQPLAREYCIQSNETDLAFLKRILADEGIHFHLEHGEEQSTVVLVDDPRGYHPIEGEPALPFREAEGALSGEHVTALRRERRIRAGSIVHRDYNFLRPQREMTATEKTPAETPATRAARELYTYPGGYVDPEAEDIGVGDDVQMAKRSGAARARMSLEVERSDAHTITGRSSSVRLQVGRRLEVKGHPDAGFDGAYVVTKVVVTGEHATALWRADEALARDAADSLRVTFVAAPADVPQRPRRLPKPRAHLRTAVVVGPKPDEPYVDAYGRIKIQFVWDREGKHDETSSCWVRMATPLAHHGQGVYAAHRVGAEVVVDFLDGDVDHPIVIGALFNGDNRQPQELPDDASRAVLYRGLGIPGNKGKNEISCEDRAGKQEIYLHAEKDLNETIKCNHTESIGANQTSSVGANQTVSVGANRTVSTGANETLSVKKKRTRTVGETEDVTIDKGRKHTVKTGGDSLTLPDGDRTVSIGSGNHTTTVKLTTKLDTKDARTHASNELELVGDVKTLVKQGGTTATFEGGHFELSAAAYVTIKHGSTSITIEDGGRLKIDAAPEVLVGCGGAEVKMASGKVEIQAPSEVSLKVGQNGVKISATGVEITGASVKSTALSGMNEISGLVVKCN